MYHQNTNKTQGHSVKNRLKLIPNYRQNFMLSKWRQCTIYVSVLLKLDPELYYYDKQVHLAQDSPHQDPLSPHQCHLSRRSLWSACPPHHHR